MVDFAGGLVVHGAAGAAGLAILCQIWREERRRGLQTSPQVPFKLSPGWLTLSILLLWVGWFGSTQQRPRLQQRGDGRRDHDLPR